MVASRSTKERYFLGAKGDTHCWKHFLGKSGSNDRRDETRSSCLENGRYL